LLAVRDDILTGGPQKKQFPISNMKTRTLLLLLLSLHLPCSAAFIFSGGNGMDLTVTLTEDLAIPFNAPSDGNSLGFVFVLEDVYSIRHPQQGMFPNTLYGTPGSITSLLHYEGSSNRLATDYAIWGTPGFDLGIIDGNDFIGTFQYQYPDLPNAQPGDILVIKAGTIVIPKILGIARPDRPVTTIQISNGSTGNPFSAAWPIEQVVVPPDNDGDGIVDDLDQCPDTPAGEIVDADGCSVDQVVPCEGPVTGGTWKNHGKYLSAIRAVVTTFVEEGLLTESEAEEIFAAASKSDCGKK
jgi:hypothetical protein